MIVNSSPFDNRSKNTIKMWMSVCHVPRLFYETAEAVSRPTEVGSAAMKLLSHRIHQLRKVYIDWHRQYKELLSEHCEDSLEQARIDKRYETLGAGLGITVVLNRLILALNFDTARELEDESQELSREIVQLERRAYAANPRAGIFMAFKMMIAHATIETRAEWQIPEFSGDKRLRVPQRTVSIQAWERWCSMKGRETKGRKVNKLVQCVKQMV